MPDPRDYPADFRDVDAWRDVPDHIAHDAVDTLMAVVALVPEGDRKQAIVRAVLALVAMRSPDTQVVVTGGPMPEPTFGHQRNHPCIVCGEGSLLPPFVCIDCARYAHEAVRWPQPDDPGAYAHTCVRCGEPDAFGPMRMCAAHQPDPAPWWAHLLRTVDERALLLRLWRGVRRFMARCAGEGM